MSLDLESAVFLSGSGESAKLAVLVNRVADPVDPSVVANGVVGRVDQDHLEVLVHSILVDPVRVQHPESSALASDTLLSDRAQVPNRLQLGNTGIDGLSVDNTLADRLLAVSTADTHTVDNVSLLGLVTQPAGLIRPGRLRQASDGRQLPVLPAAHTLQETEHIRLLALPELLDVLVGTHDCLYVSSFQANE